MAPPMGGGQGGQENPLIEAILMSLMQGGPGQGMTPGAGPGVMPEGVPGENGTPDDQAIQQLLMQLQMGQGGGMGGMPPMSLGAGQGGRTVPTNL